MKRDRAGQNEMERTDEDGRGCRAGNTRDDSGSRGVAVAGTEG